MAKTEWGCAGFLIGVVLALSVWGYTVSQDKARDKLERESITTVVLTLQNAREAIWEAHYSKGISKKYADIVDTQIGTSIDILEIGDE